MIKIYLLITIIFSFLLIGCSSTKQVTGNDEEIQNEEPLTEATNPSEAKNKAMEYFINGAISETKGDYPNAILDFQNALKYDTSAGIYYSLAKNYYYLGKTPLGVA